MTTACESYKISLIDDVNSIELMISDRQEAVSNNIKMYTIQQDDLKVINVVNKDNKSLRLELTDNGDFHYYYGKFLFKEYIYIILYDGDTHKSMYSKYINLTDMNYKARLYSIKECVFNTIGDLLLSFLLTPNILIMLVIILIVIISKDDITKWVEHILKMIS